MNYINKTVSVYGTEAEFMRTFATELNSADNRIVCETDIEAEFSKGDEYEPIIVFNVNNCYKIKFKRQTILRISASTYYITCIINGNETTYSKYLEFSQSNYYTTDVAKRCYKFSIVFNTNYIAINFTSYDYTLPSQSAFSMFSYHTDDFNVVSKESDTAGSATQRLLIRTDETGKGDTYTFANRLNYSRGENVEFIESKVLVRSDNAERDTTTDIIDCSTVSKDSIVDINSIKYYALDSHTLVKIQKGKVKYEYKDKMD